MEAGFVGGGIGGGVRLGRRSAAACGERRGVRVMARMDGVQRAKIEVSVGEGIAGRHELVEVVAAAEKVAEPEVQEGFLEKYAGSVGYVWLYFGAFCVGALGLKWARQKQMEMKNEQPKNPTIITSDEMEADLHVFKCGNCGYEMYPARTREFKFFPADFKCPVCAATRDAFWDLNDPNDPRNLEDDEDEDEEDEGPGEVAGDGSSVDGDGSGPAVATEPVAEQAKDTDVATDAKPKPEI